MKVIAVLENDIAGGGGFNQALNAIVQMQRLCKGRFEFEVFTTRQPNLALLLKLGVSAEYFSFSMADRLIAALGPYPLWHSLQARLKATGPFEKALEARGCDLAYFVTPSALSGALQRLNFIATVWDLCHRDTPEFPEVRQFGVFQGREHHLRSRLGSALAVLADSPRLGAALAHRYGIDLERVLAMPFAAAPFLEEGAAAGKPAVLAKYALNEGYFFYPAQFWAHKNHIRILEALARLRDRGRVLHAVFAGGDQGNRSYVEKRAAEWTLDKQVRFLGFVPSEDMRGLYEGCCALVMPTYFGPTNIPPLEAWASGKPVIYPIQFKSQVGEAAICVDPDDAEALADAMLACTDPGTAAELAKRGAQRLSEIEKERTSAEADLLSRLTQFERRRRCWL